ncbi:uncharacterized protein LOC136037579 [Artemia franciscana]
MVSTEDDPGGNFANTALTAPPTVTYQSTCHLVLAHCQSDMICRRYLDPVLRYCDLQLCSRDLCMQSLQAFYREVDTYWAMEVAFCVCRKTDNPNDACLVAQERLHPKCARKPPRVDETPGCHTLADSCRAKPDCKPKLEMFEQYCAVDVSTKTCDGPTEGCRRAVIGILGTELRTSCACRAHDVGTVYSCIGWQRLLWINPCVIDAHREYHRTQGNIILSHLNPGTTELEQRRTTQKEHRDNTKGTSKKVPSITERKANPTSQNRGTSVLAETIQYTYPEKEEAESTTELVYTQPSTRSCSAIRPNQPEIFIGEGSGKRLYREEEPECSELCICKSMDELSCTILSCVERKHCETNLAFYSHAGPAYQAYRGECICYSGSFICARPEPDTYNLAPGIYLFLGYSQTDENLLKPFTGLTIPKDVVAKMQFLMGTAEDPEDMSGGKCMLTIYYSFSENVILQARLPELDLDRKNFSLTLDKIKKEQELCTEEVKSVAKLIRKRHNRVYEDILLSAVKVVDVGAQYPEPMKGAVASLRIIKDAYVLAICSLSIIVLR